MQASREQTIHLNFQAIDPSWLPLVKSAVEDVNPAYLTELTTHNHWLPGSEALFNALSIPLSQTRYILFGESPYPRAASANGYAFWDAAVHEIWSPQGLAKPVNRATSLRNFIKMLLVAEGLLTPETVRPEDIQLLNKTPFISTLDELFNKLLNHGFCLLNASLVFREQQVKQDAKAWLPFINRLLEQLRLVRDDLCLILLGNVAKIIHTLPSAQYFNQIVAEHPYNISFIQNPIILEFFQPFHLLMKD